MALGSQLSAVCPHLQVHTDETVSLSFFDLLGLQVLSGPGLCSCVPKGPVSFSRHTSTLAAEVSGRQGLLHSQLWVQVRLCLLISWEGAAA